MADTHEVTLIYFKILQACKLTLSTADYYPAVFTDLTRQPGKVLGVECHETTCVIWYRLHV